MSAKDLVINLEHGTFGKDNTFFRVTIKDEDKIINKLGNDTIQAGFGVEPNAAIQDFINRNKSSLLNQVFEKVG